MATTVEVSGGGGETGEVMVHADGFVAAITGSSPHGQGHVTTFAQLIADQLGVSPGQVTIRYGDTDSGHRGSGTMGSRSGTLGGNALQAAAATVRGKLMEAAAALLEAAPEDLILKDGAVSVRECRTAGPHQVNWSLVLAPVH